MESLKVMQPEATKVVEKPNIFVEQKVAKVAPVIESRLKDIMKDIPKNSRNFFQPGSTFEVKGEKSERFYGIVFDKGAELRTREFRADGSISMVKEPVNEKLVRFLVYYIDEGVNRIENISGEHVMKFLPVRVKEYGGATVVHSGEEFGEMNFGIQDITDLRTNVRTGYPESPDKIRETVRHEAIHMLRVGQYGSDKETLSQLGSFLLDPKAKEKSFQDLAGRMLAADNDIKFVSISKAGLVEHERDLLTGSKILLGEYKKMHPELAIPETQKEQLELVKKLPSLYSEIPQTQRDALLKTYILMPDEEVDKRASEYGKDLNLKFSI